jgi:hypothetical protein
MEMKAEIPTGAAGLPSGRRGSRVQGDKMAVAAAQFNKMLKSRASSRRSLRLAL